MSIANLFKKNDYTIFANEVSADKLTLNNSYNFPSADGSASQVLSTDGNGNLSWKNDSISTNAGCLDTTEGLVCVNSEGRPTQGQALIADSNNIATWQDIIISNTTFSSDVIPSSTETYDIGSSTGPKKWRKLYTTNITDDGVSCNIDNLLTTTAITNSTYFSSEDGTGKAVIIAAATGVKIYEADGITETVTFSRVSSTFDAPVIFNGTVTGTLTGNADTATNTSNVSTKTAINVANIVDDVESSTHIGTYDTLVRRYTDGSIIVGDLTCGSISNIDFLNHLLPNANETYDIGSSTGPKKWNKLYTKNITDDATDVTISSDLILTSNLKLGDTDKIFLGSDDDMQLYHNGSSSGFLRNDLGQLLIQNTDLNSNITIKLGTSDDATSFIVRNNANSTLLKILGEGYSQFNITRHVGTTDNSIDGTEGNVNIKGDLTFYNGTKNTIVYRSAGFGDPTLTNRSVGTKIVLDPHVSSSELDFGIGCSSSSMWFSTNDDASDFKWHTTDGSSVLTPMELSGGGRLTVYRKATTASLKIAEFHSDNTSGTGAGLKCAIGVDGDIYNDTGVYGTLSDKRLKENIKPVRNGYLKDINQLQVKNFNFKADPSKSKQIGFIAQEFEKVFPSLVKTDVNEKTKAIKTTVLIPILIKCIQELTTEVKSLKSRLDILEN